MCFSLTTRSVAAFIAGIGVFSMKATDPLSVEQGWPLYSIGEDSCQTLEKAQRLEMTINGEPVAEIDIRASCLTLLHGLMGSASAAGVAFDPKERDPYQAGNLSRAIVKAWIAMTIGHKSFHRRWPSPVIEDLRDGDDGIGLKKYPINAVQHTILSAIPILADWPKQTLSGFDLMYSESDAVIGTMIELMNEHGLPSLSVHDSLVVPIHRAQLAYSVLERQFREIAGIAPQLTMWTAKEPCPRLWSSSIIMVVYDHRIIHDHQSLSMITGL